jgi:hypothetical protein
LDGDALPWQNFAILAHALACGHDLADIPLMRDIVARTVNALAQPDLEETGTGPCSREGARNNGAIASHQLIPTCQ